MENILQNMENQNHFRNKGWLMLLFSYHTQDLFLNKFIKLFYIKLYRSVLKIPVTYKNFVGKY